MKTICCKQNNFFSLVEARQNVLYKIIGINNCLDVKFDRRLCELGFLPNETIVLIKKSFQEKMYLVAVCGVVYTLREDVARCVQIGAL